MAIVTDTFTVTAVPGGGNKSVNHIFTAGVSLVDILRVKVVPDAGGGTTEVEFFKEDLFTSLAYAIGPKDGTVFDPAQIESGVETEGGQGLLTIYEDLDGTNELHIRIHNNAGASRNFDVEVDYIERPSTINFIDGSGTVNKIPLWNDADTLTDSIMSESGSVVNVSGSLNVSSQLRIGGTSINVGGTLSNVVYLDNAQTIAALKTIAANVGVRFNDGAPATVTNKLYRVGGNLVWNGTTLGFGTIDGSGSAGSLPKFSDSDTLTDSLLSESGSIVTLAGTQLLITSAAANSVISLNLTNDVQSWIVRADGNSGDRFKIRDNTNAQDVVVVEPNAGNNILFIDSNGNVSIGNNSPQAKLHVEQGNSTVTAPHPNSAGLVLEHSGTTGMSILTPNANLGTISFGDPEDSKAGRFYYNHITGQFVLDVEGVQNLTLNSNNMLLVGFDNGSSIGRYLEISRNTNATTPAAGFMALRDKGNTSYRIWPDDTGVLRIHTADPTNANDAAGTVVGAQTSWYEEKESIVPSSIGPEFALEKVLETKLYDFVMYGVTYNCSPVIFEKNIGDWYSWNDDLDKNQVPALNERQISGYLINSIKALHKKIEMLESQLATK